MSYLDNSGVSYLWSKIKAAFAAKSHTHAAGDITSGTLGTARGGTGATTAAAARANLDAAQSNGATGTLKAAEDAISGIEGSIAAYVEDANVATRTYGGGEYVMVGDSLVIITSPLNIGVTIDDTNSNQINVIDEFFSILRLNYASKTHGHDASNITSGTIPVARGGTGQSGLVSEYVVANVATAGTGCSILGVQYHQWGKVAQLYIGIRCTSAKSSGDVLATIVSGKRPMMTTPLTNLANASQFCAVYDNGQVQAKSSLAAGAEVYVIGTYLLP